MSRNPKGPPKGTHSILEGIDLRKPECKGYLFKQSKTHRAYNQRYFALYKKLLVYYETEDEFVHDVGLNTLQHRHNALLLDGLYLTKPQTKPTGAKYCFVLHCPHTSNPRKELLLVAHSKDDRKMWMEKLQDQNKHLVALPKKTASGGTSAKYTSAQPKPAIKIQAYQKPADRPAERSKEEPKTIDKPATSGSKEEPKTTDKPATSDSKEEPKPVREEPKHEVAEEMKPSQPTETKAEEALSSDDQQETATVRVIIPAESDVSFTTDRDTEPQHLEVITEHSDDEETPIKF